MNIGVVVDNEFYNDIRVNNECKIIAESHTVNVLCFDFGNELKSNSEYNITKIKINRKHKDIMFALMNTIDLYSLFWAKHIHEFVITNNIKILHVHDLYMSKAAHIALKGLSVKFILDLHENYPIAIEGYKWMNKSPNKLIIKPNSWKKKEKFFLSYPDKIIVLSEWFKEKLINKYNYLTESKIVIYPNIPNIKEMLSYEIQENILDKKSNDFIMFYFGGISKRRGVFIVFDSLKILIKKYPNIKFLLIGPIDKNERIEFLDIINNSELKNNIIFYEWKDIKLLPSYIYISDVCLSPIEKNDQHESGIANKVYQYMLLERPSLVSDCKPQADLISTENAGLVHKWDSVTDFTEKLEELYNNPEIRKKMGGNGKKAILEKYSTNKFGVNILKAYTDIIN
jgi:glycosyltransferase involved in cell wall biosynthesis